MSSIMKVIPLLLVTQMKSSKRWIHSNMEFEMTPCVEWIPFAVVVLVMKEMVTTQQTLLIAVMCHIRTELTIWI